MAILDFLVKKREESLKPVQSFTPKPSPPRGPGGKFVSKKKLEKTEEKPKAKISHVPKGPFMTPFGGTEVRKFYASGKWYYNLEDLLSLGHAVPPLKTLTQLKKDKNFQKILEKNIKSFGDVDCADSRGAIEILKEIIKNAGAEFPGSTFRWLEDISNLPFTIIEVQKTLPGDIPQANPSDRG